MSEKLDDPALSAVRQAVELVIQGHAPYPALAVDRHWTMVTANDAAASLLVGVDPALLQPPVNVMRVALHPSGLAPRTVNLIEWRTHLLERLRRQVEATADPVLLALLEELRGYPVPSGPRITRPARDYAGVVLPFELVTEAGVMAFFIPSRSSAHRSTLRCRSWRWRVLYPADDATAEILQRGAALRRDSSIDDPRRILV